MLILCRQFRRVPYHQDIFSVLFHGGGAIVEAAGLEVLVVNNQKLVVVDCIASVQAHGDTLVRQEGDGGDLSLLLLSATIRTSRPRLCTAKSASATGFDVKE